MTMEMTNAATLPELIRFLLVNDVQLRTDGTALDYDAPAGVIGGELLDRLRRHKPELVGWLTANDPGRQVVARALPSYSQQELWHRARTSPCPAVYTVGLRLAFDGPFDASTLETALGWLVERHEPLRTRFRHYAEDGGGLQPVQEVLAPWRITLDATDLTGASAADGAMNEHCAELVAEPFILDRAPLWLARLFRLAEERHVLLWMLHHSVCDGTSIEFMLDELLAAYQAVRTGQRPPAGPVALTHAGFARWQRGALTGDRLDRLARFWRAQLDGAPLTIGLPGDRPRPAQPSGRGGIHEVRVPAETVQQLRTAARSMNTTLYGVVFSAYAQLLAELSGQPAVVVPISHANRTEPEHEGVVGLLADRIPIRVDVAAAATFAELAARVGETVFAAMDHRAMPLSLLVDRLPAAQRPPAPYPTVLFTLLDQGGGQARRLPGLSVTVTPDGPGDLARMELYCFLSVTPDGSLAGAMEYAADLFDAGTIATWAGRFVARLNDIVAHAGQPTPR